MPRCFSRPFTLPIRSRRLSASFSEEPIDIVFIAMREDGDAINRFIKRLKQELAGRDAAYVLLLESRRDSVEIARTLVDGADAILLEPYSVESLHTISRLAEKIKKERSRMRMQVPLRLLVREIAAQLGQVARLEKSGASASVSRGVLQEMCSVLGELDQETRSLYSRSSWMSSRRSPQLTARCTSALIGA